MICLCKILVYIKDKSKLRHIRFCVFYCFKITNLAQITQCDCVWPQYIPKSRGKLFAALRTVSSYNFNQAKIKAFVRGVGLLRLSLETSFSKTDNKVQSILLV